MPTRQLERDRIVRDLRVRLLAGALSRDAPLPSVRALARRENVSLATVQHAYRQLEAEGLVQARPGRGRVAADLTHRQRQRIALAILREATHQPIADAIAAGLSHALVRRELLRLFSIRT